MINTVEKVGCYTKEHLKKFIEDGGGAYNNELIMNEALNLLADLLNGTENIGYIKEEVIYWNHTVNDQQKIDNRCDRFKDDKKRICLDSNIKSGPEDYIEPYDVNIPKSKGGR